MTIAPRISLVTRLDIAPAALFRFWVDPALLRRWWAGEGEVVLTTLEARPGGRFWIAVRSPQEGGYENYGTYRTLVPGELIEIDWESRDRHVSHLVVQLVPDGARTELSLTHRDFASEAARDRQEARWRAALAALEAAVAAGTGDAVRP